MKPASISSTTSTASAAKGEQGVSLDTFHSEAQLPEGGREKPGELGSPPSPLSADASAAAS